MAEATATTAYVTTERVGNRVAGRVVEPGQADQELQLTAEEAAFALGEGTLVRKGETLSGGFGDTSKAADAIRADIAAERARYAQVRAGARNAAPAPAAEAAPVAKDPATKDPETPPAETGGAPKTS